LRRRTRGGDPQRKNVHFRLPHGGWGKSSNLVVFNKTPAAACRPQPPKHRILQSSWICQKKNTLYGINIYFFFKWIKCKKRINTSTIYVDNKVTIYNSESQSINPKSKPFWYSATPTLEIYSRPTNNPIEIYKI